MPIEKGIATEYAMLMRRYLMLSILAALLTGCGGGRSDHNSGSATKIGALEERVQALEAQRAHDAKLQDATMNYANAIQSEVSALPEYHRKKTH